MNLLKHQLYLLEQHSESFKIWSAIIRINTEGPDLFGVSHGVQPMTTRVCTFSRLYVNGWACPSDYITSYYAILDKYYTLGRVQYDACIVLGSFMICFKLSPPSHDVHPSIIRTFNKPSTFTLVLKPHPTSRIPSLKSPDSYNTRFSLRQSRAFNKGWSF